MRALTLLLFLAAAQSSAQDHALTIGDPADVSGSQFSTPSRIGAFSTVHLDTDLSSGIAAALYGRAVFDLDVAGSSEYSSIGVLGVSSILSALDGYPASGAVGVRAYAEKLDGGTGGSVYGLDSRGWGMAGDAAFVVGGYFGAGVWGGGSAADAVAVSANCARFGSGALAACYGVSIAAPIGSIGSTVGIRVNSGSDVGLLLGGTLPAADHAVYSSWTEPSYLAGPLSVDGYIRPDNSSAPPIACSSAIDGAIYYDTDIRIHCACRAGTGWVQMDDYSTGCA